MINKILFTPDGLNQLKEKLDKLEKEKRPQIVERLQRAREMGDLSENSDYQNAKDELSLMEGKILELNGILGRAKAVNKKKNCLAVALGCQVKVQKGKQENLFHIVGEWESDPTQQKISHSSPLGQALIGKKVGEKVEFEAPVGKIVYKILSIN